MDDWIVIIVVVGAELAVGDCKAGSRADDRDSVEFGGMCRVDFNDSMRCSI